MSAEGPTPEELIEQIRAKERPLESPEDLDPLLGIYVAHMGPI